ncbi:MAG: alpha-glucuronidase [Duncaniella sp.]|nr:alpha-glucuronidase [Duncaniella sp.]
MNRLLSAAALTVALCSQGAVVNAPSGKPGSILSTACGELRALPANDTVCVKIAKAKELGPEGYTISRSGHTYTLTAHGERGVLYGAMHLAYGGVADGTTLSTSPKFATRILNHWDNLDGTVERGYAGRSLWKWEELPEVVSPRYEEYARRLASAGINATVLNNVNASPLMLSRAYLEKVKILADIFRPYGIKVYLSVNFATPMGLDSLPTADPLDRDVQKWWKRKADEIYSLIPDFGGFLVKANSEGQPGPMDFGRSHADGANMLARALRSHGGKVMWRAFVYSPIDADRAKQAYMEFQPLDGQFEPNVTVQVKNGPVDFQPREPYSPLFGAMPHTPQTVEFQITQEYLGHSNHLAFLAPMWEEFFSYVSPDGLTAVAGVANIGDEAVMTGNPMADANLHAFGRLAWNPSLSPAEIAREWIDTRLLTPDAPESIREALTEMMVSSHETVTDYMMPLGLHHIFAFGHHYGPEPWCDVEGARPDWLPGYYHRADSDGLGFDRTPSGSNAVEQYPEPLRSRLADIDKCPEELLLWFHHVPWKHRMKSGRTLWEELCHRYARGAKKVGEYQRVWDEARPWVDKAVWQDVSDRLVIQARDAQWWKDACLLYFAGFSGLPLTDEALPVVHTLDELKKVSLGIDNYTNPTPALLNSKR